MIEWDSELQQETNMYQYRADMLQSAVITCQQEYYEDFFLKAAALTRSLIKNHPFTDGNKRTAVMALMMFLGHNGYQLACPQGTLVSFALKIARGYITDLVLIKSWIKRWSRKLPTEGQEKLNSMWQNICNGFLSLFK